MFPLRTDVHTRACYAQAGGIHRIIPAAVARPTSIEELRAALQWAQARGLAVTPRGAGSAMSGSAVGAGMVLDLGVMECGVRCEVVPGARVVRAAAGVTLGEIEGAAARHGLRLGPDPSSAAWATVAGTVSTNAAGARSYRAGAMDRWVESVVLETMDGPLTLHRGEAPPRDHPVVARFHEAALPVLGEYHDAVLARWPRTRKHAAGYGLDRYWKSGHLIDLVIGSEGTLGVITQAELRLEPIPTQRAALRLALADRADLATVIEAIATVGPGTIELLDRSLLRLMADRLPAAESAALWRQAAALLLVDLECDDRDELAHRVAQAVAAVGGIVLDVRAASAPADIAELWAVRHHASPVLAALSDGRRSLQIIEDGCVPVHALGRYLDAVEQACAAATTDAVMFGHAGDGHVHVNLLPDPSSPDWLGRVAAIWQRVTAALLELQGTPAGEHGAGRLRAGQLEQFLGPEAMACFSAIKRAFDPLGLFNRGVILPDGRDPLANLKVGSAAAPLPPEQEALLRRIEEERRWGESRWRLAGDQAD